MPLCPEKDSLDIHKSPGEERTWVFIILTASTSQEIYSQGSKPGKSPNTDLHLDQVSDSLCGLPWPSSHYHTQPWPEQHLLHLRTLCLDTRVVSVVTRWPQGTGWSSAEIQCLKSESANSRVAYSLTVHHYVPDTVIRA